MYNRICDYALIGDTHSTALISSHGSIDWLCWPRHDSPALFLKMLDDRKGGFCDIEWRDLESVSRRYWTDTNILETTFVTKTGRATLIDFMPITRPAEIPDEGPDGEAEKRLVRIVTCYEGHVAGRFRVSPTFDYARNIVMPDRDGQDMVYRGKPERIRVTSSCALESEGSMVFSDFLIAANEETMLVLAHDGQDKAPPLKDVAQARHGLDRTSAYWREWGKQCTYDGPYRDAVMRSVLCLKLLTYSPTGAIVAAPTIGLPEALPGNRNFDYRYSWLRDASFTVTSFVNLGYTREAAEYLRFLREADPSRGRYLKLMYGIAGPIPDEEPLRHLEGWRGAYPVSIGNAAHDQDQHDIYGEFLMALHLWLDAVDYDPPHKVNDHLPDVITNLAERAIEHRHSPDHGIWETREKPLQMLHTKGLLWVALTCAASIGQRIGSLPDDRIREWLRIAEEIREEYLDKAWNPERKALMQAYGSDVLDAAVMRLVLFGAVDVNDPRFVSTFDAIERELADGDLIYRFRADDGFDGVEATFTACTFWRVGCLAMAGKTRAAKMLYERILQRGSDLGLFAEEIDAGSGEQRGNYPQGFTHMALINHAIRLQSCIESFGLKD